MGRTQWLGGWREETREPATVGASLRHPDSLPVRASSRSTPAGWEAPPALISRHDDQGFSVKAEHCGGEKKLVKTAPRIKAGSDKQRDSFLWDPEAASLGFKG